MMHTNTARMTRRACCLVLSMMACVGSPAIAQQGQSTDTPADHAAERIEATRAALSEWRKVRDVISQERRDWTLRRQVLEDRISLMRTQIDQVQQQIAEREEELAGFDSKIGELEQTNEKLAEASESLARAVDGMEQRTVALLRQAPAPLREQVRPLAVQLPGYTGTKSATTDTDHAVTSDDMDEEQSKSDEPRQIPLAQRFQNVIGVLNMVNKFNGVITVNSELQTQPDGSSISVASMYLGLGQGFYVDQAGSVAAVGTPGPEGWMWTPANASALQIKRAIDVFNSEQPASFVGLPVEVK